jgi:signal transduction histidine kinase
MAEANVRRRGTGAPEATLGADSDSAHVRRSKIWAGSTLHVSRRFFKPSRSMSPPPRRSSLRRQLVLPVVGLLLAGVLANVAFASWLAARRAADVARQHERQVVETLATSRVTLTLPVLETLSRLTDSQFVVWNPVDGSLGTTTLDRDRREELTAAGVAAALDRGTTTLGGRSFRVATVRSGSVRPETVVVFTPRRSLASLALESSWPQLAVAAVTLALLVPASLAATGMLARRIGTVERRVAAIAEGDFGREPAGESRGDDDSATIDDEIGRLSTGVERMSGQLGQLRARLLVGERERLLGQLAAGFAHELRNAVTGARLAIDLHRGRCSQTQGDGSLGVAIRQLAVVEEEVRGLLALGKRTESAPEPLIVDALFSEVGDLVSPRCQHGGTMLEVETPTGISIVARRDSLRAALLNLVVNAIDAAGRGGVVRLEAHVAGDEVRLAVEDTGPGPPEHLANTLHEPFVTGKPEGIGLGLAIVTAVAEEHDGRLEWGRVGDRTRFTIILPAGAPFAGPHLQRPRADTIP